MSKIGHSSYQRLTDEQRRKARERGESDARKAQKPVPIIMSPWGALASIAAAAASRKNEEEINPDADL